MTNGNHVTRVIGLGVIVLLLAGLNASALIFNPTFGYSNCSTAGYPSDPEPNARCYAQTSTGTIKLWADAIAFQEYSATAQMGDVFTPTQDGMLPNSYTATTSVNGHIKAEFLCYSFNGGDRAELELRLLRWQRTAGSSNAWTSNGNFFLEKWDCGVYDVVNENFAYSEAMVYEKGKQYRLALQAKAFAKAVGLSGAWVDACSGETTGHCTDSGTERVRLDSISIQNQLPYAVFPYDGSSFWWPEAVLFGADVKGRACDPDVQLSKVRVGFESDYTDKTTTQDCQIGTHHWTPIGSLPGSSHQGFTKAWDNENAATTAWGDVSLDLFPLITGTVAGYPDLSQYNPTSSAEVQTAHSTSGDILGYRVTIDGIVVADTIVGSMVGVSLLTEDYDLATDEVTVTNGATVMWSGTVTYAGPSWWNVVPAS